MSMREVQSHRVAILNAIFDKINKSWHLQIPMVATDVEILGIQTSSYTQDICDFISSL